MNILFFLTPKEEVAHVEEDDTLRQVVEKLEYHGYSGFHCWRLMENISVRSRRGICCGR